MAEETKNPEVELDTDGVTEQNVDVPEAKEPDESFAPKENVDLGYTDVSKEEDNVTGEKTAKELLQETKQAEPEPEPEKKVEPEDDEGLKDYSDKVQKRIKKLTFQVREAERKERAALDYAKGLKEKFESAEKRFEETDTNYLKEYDARIEAERIKVKNDLKVALDAQDSEKIMEANDALTKLAVEKEKVSMSLQDKEARKKEEESQPQAQEQVTPPVSQRAQKWAEDNDWFGSDRVLTNAAMSIHEELVQQGIDGESDEYYNQINKRMKEYFPQKFAQSSTEEQPQKAAPVQNVASVSRRQGGRKSVKLTKSQVVIAKKLGVPLEEYAKYVKEGV
tara:strand:- start:64 stop:1071 length:1008 start_codon:yes stop_codon:yes gene_type:complete